MKINKINFKGTFSIPHSDNYAKNREKILRKSERYQMEIDRVLYRDEIDETHITIPDELDSKFEKFLIKKDIPYYYFNITEHLDKNEIHDRITLGDMDQFGYELKEINVKMLDNVLKKNQKMYVGYGGKGGIDSRYLRFLRYLHTKNKIQAPTLSLMKNSTGKIIIELTDGRHRFAVLRDLGLETIPVALSEQTRKIAKETGLF